MLEGAKATFEAACGPGLGGAALVQCAAQDLLTNPVALEALGIRVDDPSSEACVDLILFHAVVEWMAAPLEALRVLERLLQPGGYLSCLYYNR
jgi:S-adenosylmethionine-dependent methyltransferase